MQVCDSISGCNLRIVCSLVAAIVFGQCADLGPEHGSAGEEDVAALRARRGRAVSAAARVPQRVPPQRRRAGAAQAAHGAAHACSFLIWYDGICEAPPRRTLFDRAR